VQTFRNASLFRSRDQQPLTRSLVHDDDAPAWDSDRTVPRCARWVLGSMD
jgi:hypothetical protein